MANALKFFKVATLPKSGLTVGGVYFANDTHALHVATSTTETTKYSGVSSATYNNETHILTIINEVGTTLAFDFSKIASIAYVTDELGKLKTDLIGTDRDTKDSNTIKGAKKYADSVVAPALTKIEVADSNYVDIINGSDNKKDKIDIKIIDLEELTDNGQEFYLADAAGAKKYIDGKVTVINNNLLNNVTLTGAVSGTGTRDGNGVSVATTINSSITNSIKNAKTTLTEASGDEALIHVTKKAGSSSTPDNYTITANNIAKASELSSEITRAKQAEGALSGRIDTLSNSISGGTFFKGIVDALPDPTTRGYKNGDIIAISSSAKTNANKEFIYSGETTKGKWVELGDTTAEAKRITDLETFNKTAFETSSHKVKNATNADTASNATKVYDLDQTQLTTAVLNNTSGEGSGDFINSASLANGKLTVGVGNFDDVTVGNATSANKVAKTATLKINGGTTEGTSQYTFDGSTEKTLDIIQGSNVTLTAAAGKLTISAKDTPNTDTVTTFTASGDNYITLTHAGSGFTGQSVKATADVSTDISKNTTADTKLADAHAVKTYVDGAVSGAMSWATFE